MRTKDELFREALRHIAARRQQAVTAAERDRAAALAAHPELRAAEDARTHAGLTLTLAAARGADQTAAAAALKTADERLTAAYATLGLGPEGFVPHYTCPTCKDTGMVNGRPCSCVAEAARTLRREEINAASPLALCSLIPSNWTATPPSRSRSWVALRGTTWAKCWPTASGTPTALRRKAAA